MAHSTSLSGLGQRSRERLLNLVAYGLLILAIAIVFFPSALDADRLGSPQSRGHQDAAGLDPAGLHARGLP